jgi:hypothetical protein
MPSISTTTMVHASDQSSSGKDSSSKNGSALNGVNSDTAGSGSSGTANSTDNSAGGSSGNTGGGSNGGGGTQSDNRSRGPSSHPASSSPQRPEAAHCDQSGWPSCYRLGFQDGKNHAGSACPLGHSANFCSGWNVGASSYIPSSSCPVSLIKSHCPLTKITGVTGLGTILEIAPDAPAGPHTSEYIEAFNTASANPYKPGTKQYENYQKGLDDAKKAGRDCDKMDTCGGPDLLGNTVKGVLHLNDQQYCGNGFGVHSSKLCKFREGCTANSLGTVTCPQPQSPLPRNCYYILGRLICRPAISM